MLEYKEKMRDWPLERQATAYRGMVFAQSQEENVLKGVASASGICRMILSKESDQERQGIAGYINDLASRVVLVTVSYVGKANYREVRSISVTSDCGHRLPRTYRQSEIRGFQGYTC